jgi:hypothetical protein
MWEMGHTMSLLLRALILLVESTYPDPLDLSKDQVHIEKGGLSVIEDASSRKKIDRG